VNNLFYLAFVIFSSLNIFVLFVELYFTDVFDIHMPANVTVTSDKIIINAEI